MLSTRFTRLVGCSVPIQLAGMGRVLTAELAAAVSEAGGLGMVTDTGAGQPALEAKLNGIRERTARPFGVNFLIPILDRENIRMAAGRAKVCDFFWGEPDRALVDLVHSAGALASWQVGSLREALAARDAGCDFIIAQGIEAGGHIRGKIGVLALLNEVLDAVDVPVLAAGGIGSGRSLAAVLAAGASGARMGTRFIATRESAAHPSYIAALIAARSEDSIRSTRHSVNCELCPSTHGVLASAVEAADRLGAEIAGEFQSADGKTRSIPKFAGFLPDRTTLGHIEAMALYAGQSVGSVREVTPAADVVREVAERAEQLLKTWLGEPAAPTR